ncbi:transmembrane and coiled-coil domain protein 3 isoform X1 [Lepisosteus oculatus]|uniref:transmembrane and coiled-coil domain protein 3 isoform X1 n=1 Tax=Lepisosteus oculatus TaxID=7918 RepID=UPI0007401446|nr:PREDICTED: transmembrane and coiled-coil domains protein 3 isoform X1 [Lepisosteus oculatus]
MPDAELTVAADKSLPESGSSHETRQNMADPNDVSSLSIPVPIRRGGSDTNLNFSVTDGVSNFHWLKPGNENLQQKILKIAEQIRIEKTACDENVAEYLKLVNTADKQQARRIRQVFEKKNQKSTQSIAQLQKKLEQYLKKINESEMNSSSKAPKESKESSKENLKDVHSITKDVVCSSRTGNPGVDKIKSLGPGVTLSPPFFFSKPREFANLIRNKFGSADNITQLKNTLDTFHPESGNRALSGSATIVAKPKYPSDDECSSGTSASADSNGNADCGAERPISARSQAQLAMITKELEDLKELQSHLAENLENLKIQLKRDYTFLTQTLQEERYRFERLEDQLNDLTELHQHETSNLKQELASIEEKVAYQAYERARDIQEALEACQTRISKLELHAQHQQVVQLENTDAKVLLGKCINIMLAIVTLILVCVSTAAKFTAPLMRSRLHVVCTLCAVTLLAIFWKSWDNLQCAMERVLMPS